MQQKNHLESEPSPSAPPPLPLFRPEVLESRQQKLYGDILLIRPLSLTLMACIAIALAASVLGFLLLGHHTERTRVNGVLIPFHGPATAASGNTSIVMLKVPHQALPFL